MAEIKLNEKYVLTVRNPAHYSMDGCRNGNILTVKAPVEDEPGSYWVDITRDDGSVSVDFLVEGDDISLLGTV